MKTHYSDEIRQIVSEVLNISPTILKTDTLINSLPNADSMRLLEIILAIEKQYGIEVPDTVTFNIKTIGEFEQLIIKLIEES